MSYYRNSYYHDGDCGCGCHEDVCCKKESSATAKTALGLGATRLVVKEYKATTLEIEEDIEILLF